MKEVWKPVVYNEDYLVSNLGEIKNSKGRKLKQYHYPFATVVSLKNKTAKKWLHRLIFRAFRGYYTKYVGHINGDVNDNRLVNLYDINSPTGEEVWKVVHNNPGLEVSNRYRIRHIDTKEDCTPRFTADELVGKSFNVDNT